MNEIKNFLNNFTHSYHLLRYLKSLATSEKIISTNKKTTIDKKKVLELDIHIMRFLKMKV